jgi:hypothetical protein
VGRVDWTYDGDSGNFKARKNQLQYIYTVQDLYLITLRGLGKMENVAIVKEEIAKVRLAVAADLPNYIAMAWLFDMLNDDWKKLPGMYATDGAFCEAQSHAQSVNALSSRYSLPFDYEGFDNQVET